MTVLARASSLALALRKWIFKNEEARHAPLDELENGPWPSFISGIKRLRDEHEDPRINEMTNDLLGQLQHSYQTRKGYWKGGTVSVWGGLRQGSIALLGSW